jgi:hypothetical protein
VGEQHDRPERKTFIKTKRKLKKDCGQIKAGHWTEQENQLRLLVYGGAVVPQSTLNCFSQLYRKERYAK